MQSRHNRLCGTLFTALLGAAACSSGPTALSGKYADATDAIEIEFTSPDSAQMTRVETGDNVRVSYKRIGDRLVLHNVGDDDIVLTMQQDGSLKGGENRILRKVSQ